MTLLCDQDGLHIGSRVMPIGSDEWLNWLEANKSFRFECPYHLQIQGGFTRVDTANFSAIKQGNYWQAHKKVKGKLRREHLGKAEILTYELMCETAYRICSDHYWESYKAERESKAKSQKNKTETIRPSLLRVGMEVEGLSCEISELKPHLFQLQEDNTQLRSELIELRGKNEENKKAIASLQQLLKGERDRTDAIELEGLRAATILHEALKMPANKGGGIKKKILEALQLIDDI